MQLCRIRPYRVKGAGTAGARRRCFRPAYTSGRRRRPPGCVRHPASGGTKLIRSARFDLVSERIAPVATVPVHHQRPFHAAVAHARATQPCRSIAPRTQASADAAREPRSVPSCSSDEASGVSARQLLKQRLVLPAGRTAALLLCVVVAIPLLVYVEQTFDRGSQVCRKLGNSEP
jgi:hypothetical protein